ncbi:MAG: neutral/alkaline non-lysosomal ceramidase N-terminal domain-containing protein [Actinobacteria bacterium]|nr:neutral/alkaline non-lysosomal ceramidase N-terminal domain-containing protein [Actinomycetota bacterium]
MRSFLAPLVAAALTVGALVAAPTVSIASADDAIADWDGIRAGVGIADATWHVGASSGQYSDFAFPTGAVSGGDVDPHHHATYKSSSYGVQSRLTVRALVVEGTNGERVALLKSDNYLAQDLLLRRVGQLLADDPGSQIGYDDILHAASHNHSSPYYSTPSWGVWLFQDAMDLRMLEYQAQAMYRAIREAEIDLAPARMGATTVHHELYKGNIMRPQTADDGSPAGFPNDYGDEGLPVLRFDRLTEDGFEPMGIWMNWGQHPESLDGYDLITADFLAPLERFVERDTGAKLVFSQGDVGSAEGPYDGWNRGRMDDGTLIAWAHIGHAQTERGARLLADAVVEGFEAIGQGEGDVPYATHFEVGAINGWVPGPISHPYPSVSNCRTEPTVEGDPGSPILGLPDCARSGALGSPLDPLYENLRAHGLPVPANYDAPSFTGVQENVRLRLQAIKLGDIIIASCACEAQVDLILNFESRANDVVGDLHDGFDWFEDPNTTCTQGESGEWTCQYADPEARGGRSWTFSDAAYQRYQAQVHNPADGWDELDYAPYANSEPDDPAEIKGNFTTEELDEQTGYALAIGVGHAGDYNGYTVSYREYMGYDHYRKALTSHGPHTADYMSTWMTRMARDLNDPSYSYVEEMTAQDPTTVARLAADEARQVAQSELLGRAAGTAYTAWLAALPADVGPAEILADGQPGDVSRFDAATVTWRGGSNAVDNPTVVVEREVDGAWQPFADMSGEVQTMLDMPNGVQGVADTYTGSQEWRWTASFEAFTGGPNPALGSTPPGEYRFVIDGVISGGLGEGRSTYHLESDSFTVSVWDGIPAPTVSVDGDVVTVQTERVLYPRTYESDFPFVSDDGRGGLVDPETGEAVPDDLRVCETCSFRAWAFEGEVAAVDVTIRRTDGSEEIVGATPAGDGRWTVSGLQLADGDEVVVAAGGVRDQDGNVNGLGSDVEVVTLTLSGTDEVIIRPALPDAAQDGRTPAGSSHAPEAAPARVAAATATDTAAAVFVLLVLAGAVVLLARRRGA